MTLKRVGRKTITVLTGSVATAAIVPVVIWSNAHSTEHSRSAACGPLHLPKASHAIVVYTTGSKAEEEGRLLRGLETLRRDAKAILFVDGVAKVGPRNYAESGARFLLKQGADPMRVVALSGSDVFENGLASEGTKERRKNGDTRMNSEYAILAVRCVGAKKLSAVSSDYHLPRVLHSLEVARAGIDWPVSIEGVAARTEVDANTKSKRAAAERKFTATMLPRETYDYARPGRAPTSFVAQLMSESGKPRV